MAAARVAEFRLGQAQPECSPRRPGDKREFGPVGPAARRPCRAGAADPATAARLARRNRRHGGIGERLWRIAGKRPPGRRFRDARPSPIRTNSSRDTPPSPAAGRFSATELCLRRVVLRSALRAIVLVLPLILIPNPQGTSRWNLPEGLGDLARTHLQAHGRRKHVSWP
jgi:hypothetical protein